MLNLATSGVTTSRTNAARLPYLNRSRTLAGRSSNKHLHVPTAEAKGTPDVRHERTAITAMLAHDLNRLEARLLQLQALEQNAWVLRRIDGITKQLDVLFANIKKMGARVDRTDGDAKVIFDRYRPDVVNSVLRLIRKLDSDNRFAVAHGANGRFVMPGLKRERRQNGQPQPADRKANGEGKSDDDADESRWADLARLWEDDPMPLDDHEILARQREELADEEQGDPRATEQYDPDAAELAEQLQRYASWESGPERSDVTPPPVATAPTEELTVFPWEERFDIGGQ